jgi:hypothetical protein
MRAPIATAPDALTRFTLRTLAQRAISLEDEVIAIFAHLCGVAPIDASSGKQEGHRLNRGGDRKATLR